MAQSVPSRQGDLGQLASESGLAGRLRQVFDAYTRAELTEQPHVTKAGASLAAATSEPESLKDQATHALDEARMVLPGIQALFGFQLIVVFSERFPTALSTSEQSIHLGAIVLVTIAIALVMTPAAYHRQVNSRSVTAHFISLSSKLITAAMLPLALGIGLDVYLIARVVLESRGASAFVSCTLVVLFVGLWYVMPRFSQARRDDASIP